MLRTDAIVCYRDNNMSPSTLKVTNGFGRARLPPSRNVDRMSNVQTRLGGSLTLPNSRQCE